MRDRQIEVLRAEHNFVVSDLPGHVPAIAATSTRREGVKVFTDMMVICNQDWSFWVVDRMPDSVRLAFGDQHVTYAQAEVSETGVSVRYSVADPHWPRSKPPAELAQERIHFTTSKDFGFDTAVA